MQGEAVVRLDVARIADAREVNLERVPQPPEDGLEDAREAGAGLPDADADQDRSRAGGRIQRQPCWTGA
jgi:hypothetical protein